jgi:hypothetical protein
MKVQVTGGGWPVGQWLIPAGTILDAKDWTFNSTPLPWLPPPNMMALDQEAFALMSRHYDASRVLSGPDVKRT